MNSTRNAPDLNQNQPLPETETGQKWGNSQVRLLRTLIVIAIIADGLALATSFADGNIEQYIVPVGSLLIFAIGSLIALYQGYLLPAQILLPSSLFVFITYVVASPSYGYGLHDIKLLAYAIVISLAGLTLGQLGSFIFTS